ncbi:MAG: hypothetical protein AVDCRST_MAG41-2332 [uncultured Corynebacteriales bacterium]|uniref:Carrier domain-containing protein n=1 Tax=uncultured Mycobacteriales bacterium TaxID=581187 RepID=A0A6J4IRQ7_9ACTN|nr:MAG: hypothetical protein AVDCRST_MAG41-2332 [uncultured Corynebacteriales bacterium]
MTASPSTSTAPVSPAQLGLWLIDQLRPGSSVYTVFCTVRLSGPLDPARLRAALAAVVDRHEALRTTFPAYDGVPVQRVADRLEVPLPVVDLTDLAGPAGASGPAGSDREAEAERLARHWCELPFDLAAGPLLRAGLVRLADREHLLAVAVHHIVCDGASLQVLFADLGRAYAGAELPPPVARFRDYVAGRDQDPAELGWWRDRLAGAPDLLQLPGDRPRPAVRGTAGGTRTAALPEELLTEVAALAARRRMSPFMVLLAGWGALLGRLADVPELLVGIPVTDRPEPAYEELVGLFVDTLPVRLDLSGRPTFGTVLDRVRRSVLDVLSHRSVTFDRLVEELRPDRSPGHTPLVQVAFSADLAPLAEPALPGVRAEVRVPRPDTAKFDLDLSVPRDADGTATLVLTYSAELFDPDRVDRLLTQLLRLLAAGVRAPDTPVALLPLLDAAERDTVLGGWAHTAPAAPPDLLAHELVSARAATTPDAPAVRSGGVDIGYAELDARAEEVAGRLRAAGVGPDDLVAVLRHRGPELVVAVLGVLRAGAAFLPLSPTAPAGYLAGVLAAAGARVALADPQLAGRLAGSPVRVVPDDGPWRAGTGRAHPDDLAYVLFTSGSTGEPKGVAVTHRSLANVVTTMRDMYELTPADRVLQFASIGFDIAVEEMFPTWAAGGCVVLSPDPPPGPDRMTELITRERVSFTILTSGYWRQWTTWADARGVHPAPTLRLVSVGAEPVDPDALRTWQRIARVPVLNGYGLTETTVNAAVTLLPDPFVGDLVPIGPPLRGARAYVLDADLQPVPVGVPGELHIGGDCLARGYLGRPDLTADRFVPDPYGPVPGGRLHRTGDRARWRSDGQLEILGRLDGQLKVRGHRIEPAHVEAALHSHPDVAAAVVAVRPDRRGHDRLVGYVVPRTGTAVPAGLREHLAGRLPPYLVPAALVGVPAIPRNANGKADPRALPDPADAVPVGIPARTALERSLAAVWREALDVPEPGVHDNFFELGGSSLTLATVHSRLGEALGVTVGLVALYEHPTIASLARHLAGGEQEPAPPADDRADRLRAGRARIAGRRRERKDS